MRKRIFQIVEPSIGDIASTVYDGIMMLAIVSSIIPLMFKEGNSVFDIIDIVTLALFILDYALRWFTADFKLSRGARSFIVYPFTFMAIIDLLSILPGFSVLNNGFKLLRLARMVRMIRMFRIFRIVKAFRYSKNIALLIRVLHRVKDSLVAMCYLAGAYIFISALIIFNVEPDSFERFFDALYWATVSLTSVGYGDIYAVSTVGRIVTMISAVFGIAVVAMPAGIITAGMLDELKNDVEENVDPEDKKR